MHTGLRLLKILTMLGVGKESSKTSNKVEESLVMEISFPEVSGWRHSLGTSIMGRRQEIWFTFTLSTKLCFWCVVREALVTGSGQIRSKSTVVGIKTRHMKSFCWINETLSKAQRTRELSSFIKVTAFKWHQNSTSKSLPNFSFKILITASNNASTSIFWQIFRFKTSTKHHRQNLDQTVVNTFLSISTLTSSRSFALAFSKARVTSVKSTKQQLV